MEDSNIITPMVDDDDIESFINSIHVKPDEPKESKEIAEDLWEYEIERDRYVGYLQNMRKTKKKNKKRKETERIAKLIAEMVAKLTEVKITEIEHKLDEIHRILENKN